jgi:hypothetical protein
MARGVWARTILMMLVVVGGFVAVYALTNHAFAAIVWSNTAAYFVLAAPLPVQGGRTNYLSALFRQPIARSEQARAEISVEHVTPTHRLAALLLVVTLFALAFTALGLGLTSP